MPRVFARAIAIAVWAVKAAEIAAPLHQREGAAIPVSMAQGAAGANTEGFVVLMYFRSCLNWILTAVVVEVMMGCPTNSRIIVFTGVSTRRNFSVLGYLGKEILTKIGSLTRI